MHAREAAIASLVLVPIALCWLVRRRRQAASCGSGSSSAATGVRILAQHDGLTFYHKPGGMCTHPSERPRPVRSSENLLCPACGRDFGPDQGWNWISRRDHVMASPDERHRRWRQEHPKGEGLVRPMEEEERTLWHVLRDSQQPRSGVPGVPTSGEDTADTAIRFCNRLDRGTSGIVCVASTKQLADMVQACWPHAAKEYLVLVRGTTEEAFTVRRPLTDRSTKKKEDPKRDATTAFVRLRTFGEGALSLLRATLVEGGRQHQIRRHLNAVAHQVPADCIRGLGHAESPHAERAHVLTPQVVGDAQYGKSRINALLQAEYGLPRIFLHAERLRLRLEGSEATIEVHDPLPEDLESFLERLPP